MPRTNKKRNDLKEVIFFFASVMLGISFPFFAAASMGYFYDFILHSPSINKAILLCIAFIIVAMINVWIVVRFFKNAGFWIGIVIGLFLFLPRYYARKPVIYLYPTHEQQISVRLNYEGKITASYPVYDETINGWEVIAYPDGRIINMADKKEYNYLFWEGISRFPVQYDLSKGFVVEGKNTAEFLQDVLKRLGLTVREYNEFIVYWYPLMKENKYNLVHFATEEYVKVTPLDITPKPDAILRVFMVYKAINKKVNIAPQEIKPFKREGFTVIEWGGTQLK
jgi:hypothetical protein